MCTTNRRAYAQCIREYSFKVTIIINLDLLFIEILNQKIYSQVETMI